jgi:putative DNA primase/helicase
MTTAASLKHGCACVMQGARHEVRMNADQERAASALRHLDATCSRENWVKIGMAAKAAGLDFEEFHAWSANGAKYKNESDCKSVWRSIKNDKGVGIASLFRMAIAQGWHDSKENRSRPYSQACESRATARHSSHSSQKRKRCACVGTLRRRAA